MFFHISQTKKSPRRRKVSLSVQKTKHASPKPFLSFFALTLIVFGTFGGYFSLEAATSTRRAPFVFQGRISDASYVPVADGARNMIFRIWDASTGGNCIWITGTGTTDCDSTPNSGSIDVAVTITRGIFSVPLGDTSVSGMPALDQDFDNQSSQTYYLSFSVETNTSGTYEDLSPRIRISAVPYAYNSDELDGLNSLSFFRADHTASTSGTPTAVTYTGATHTGLENAEANEINFNLAQTVTFSGGGGVAITQQRAFLVQAPTYAASAAQTISNAATLTVLNAPIAGTNITLTNSSALWLQGNSSMTRGRFLKIGYPTGTTVTQSGVIFGLDLDLNPTSGITFTTGSNAVIGAQLNMPTVAAAQAATGATHTAVNINSAEWTSTSGTNNWKGVSIDMPDITQGGTSVLTSIGLQITGGTVTSGTSYAITTNEAAGRAGFGTLTPDYRLELETAVSTTNSFALSSADVTHGRTSVDQTGTWFSVKSADNGGTGTGGALITGIGEGATGGGINMRGIIGSTDPDDTLAAVTIFGMKADGGSAFTSLGAAETVFQLINNSTVLWTALGNGNTGIGDTTPAALFTVGSGDLLQINSNGSITLAQAVVSGGQTVFTLTPGAHTAVTGSSGLTDFNIVGHTNTLTGAITTQRFNVFGQSTLSAASAIASTNASTVAIAGAPNVSGSATLTTSIALRIQSGDAPLGTGVTNAYGLYVDAPSGTPSGGSYAASFASGNVGIGTATPDTTLDLAGTLSYTPTSTQALTATTDQIVANATIVKVSLAGGGILDGAASIVDGVDGQMLYIVGTHDTNVVILRSTALTNLKMSNATRTLGAGDVLQLMFDSVTGFWLEVSFSNNTTN